MGYEIKMIIGKCCQSTPQHEKDLSKPFDDGSGFPYKRNPDGSCVETGKTEVYFMVFATLDMGKLGYQDDALNRLISSSFRKAKDNPDTIHQFYMEDGNTEITEDRYGAQMWPVSVAEVLTALNTLDDDYRRIAWAKALLASMVDDSENIQVLFYGH